MNTDIHPRVYKPEAEKIFVCVALCFIIFGVWTQVIIQRSELFNPHANSFWWLMFGLVVSIFFISRLIIQTIGYRVTLLSDGIEVANILGTKTMRRSDISAYSFHVGGKASPNFVSLTSKNDAKQNYSLIKDTNIKLNVNLQFDRDDEFDSWIMSFPCEIGGTPLPKRH